MKMKYVVAIVVIALLIGLPIGSYLYLRSGYLYRINILEVLKPKSELSPDFISYSPYDTLSYEKLKGYTTVLGDCSVSLEWQNKLKELDSQFSSSPTYRSIYLEREAKKKDMNYSNCYFTPQRYYDELFKEYDLILLDTNLQIRHYYTLNEESFKSLVEHLAIVLPRVKEKKIEFQRNK